MSPLFSWGSHYLVTDKALQHPAIARQVLKKVKVESLDAFLSAEKDAVAAVFTEFYSYLEKKGSKRFQKIPFDTQKPDTKSFIRALRLHPDIKFALVNRVLPGHYPRYPLVPARDISPHLEKERNAIFENVEGQMVTVASILTTFSDEPDWGMDLNLWNMTEYGYGKQPYGNPEGISTQAPFHITYQHEPTIVRTIKPEISEGMSPDRVYLFSALAKLAMKTGHEYWAYRFAADALHYIQDLCQPYHSKAIPHANWIYYTAAAITSNFSLMEKKTVQLIANRHFLYEDFVAYSLFNSYVEPNRMNQKLSEFLFTSNPYMKKASPKSTDSLIFNVTSFASMQGKELDTVIQKTFGYMMTQNGDYNFEDDYTSGKFQMDRFVKGLDRAEADNILQMTGKNFRSTAQASRTYLKHIGFLR